MRYEGCNNRQAVVHNADLAAIDIYIIRAKFLFITGFYNTTVYSYFMSSKNVRY